MKRKLLIAILILSGVGLILSGYSLAHHENFVAGTFCTINQTFNCDIVNRGPYSELFGIPVALIGLLGYGFIAVSAFMHLKRPTDRGSLVFLALASVGGVCFSGYLTGIETFILKTWCIVCLTSQLSILAIFFSSIALLVMEFRRPPPASPHPVG